MVVNGYKLLDLKDYFNSDGISYENNLADGYFGAVASFPAEELPESNSLVYVDGVPFIFPSKEDGEMNNIECFEECIEIGGGYHSKLYVLGGCDNGSFIEKFQLQYADKNQTYRLGLTDWIEASPRFHDRVAFRVSHVHTAKNLSSYGGTIWLQAIDIDYSRELKSIRLPDNTSFHIFAITLKIEGDD